MTYWNQISFDSRLSDRKIAVRLGELRRLSFQNSASVSRAGSVTGAARPRRVAAAPTQQRRRARGTATRLDATMPACVDDHRHGSGRS